MNQSSTTVDNILYLSDLRIKTLMIALSIYRRLDGATQVWIHESILTSNDFGSISPSVYKRLKLRILRSFLRVTVIAATQPANDRAGMLSSYYSIARKPPSEDDPTWAELGRLAQGARGAAELILQSGCRKVFLFNGRLASVSAIADAVRNSDIQLWLYEWGWQDFTFTLARNSLHNSALRGRLAVEKFLSGSEPLLAFSGRFESDYRARKLKNQFSETYAEKYTGNAEVCLFLSSSHEYYSISSTATSAKEQDLEEIIRRVREEFPHQGVVVRMHPNEVNFGDYTAKLHELRVLGEKYQVEIIDSTSSIDSYDLLKSMKHCVTHKSSIALDGYLMGVDVNILSDINYKVFTDFLKEQSPEPQPEALARLIYLERTLFQLPLHPYFFLLGRLTSFLDGWFCRIR